MSYATAITLNSFIILLALSAIIISAYFLRKERHNLYYKANYDGLTGLYRRETFMNLATKELERDKRLESGGALIFLDIDNFKKINDKFGHGQGDLVLKTVGEIINTCSRPYDLTCRYGGEEFLMFLPEANFEGATSFCARLKAETLNKTKDLKSGKVTYSIGISHMPTHGMTLEELINKADAAMYEAKKSKNTVYIYNNSLTQASK